MYFVFNFAWNSIILHLRIVLEEQRMVFFYLLDKILQFLKSVRCDKSYLLMIPYYLSLIFSLTRFEFPLLSLLNFNVPQHIPRSKERTITLWLETSKNSIFTQIILELHIWAPSPLFRFHLFSKIL